jgi:two-component system, chemotaxis family, response regulator Rcp1
VRPLRILVVESNPADAYLTVEALKQAGATDPIQVITDGEEAVKNLRQLARPDALPPDLILLDLRLEPISGFDVLTAIRSLPRLEAVPVVMLSGSTSEQDVRKSYELRANCYITKPSGLDQFLHSIKTCYEFWGRVATLPANLPARAKEA